MESAQAGQATSARQSALNPEATGGWCNAVVSHSFYVVRAIATAGLEATMSFSPLHTLRRAAKRCVMDWQRAVRMPGRSLHRPLVLYRNLRCSGKVQLPGRDALSIYDFGQMFLSHELKALMNGCLLKALAILRLCCTGTGNVARHKGILVHRERKR